MKEVTKDTHKAKFKKFGLVSNRIRYSIGWDHKCNTFANDYQLAPKAKVLMDDVEDYLIDKGYSHAATNTALMLDERGFSSKFRCHYYKKKKFDFVVVFTRQRKGKKEYVTSIDHHYEDAKGRIRPDQKIEPTKPKTVKRKRLTKQRR